MANLLELQERLEGLFARPDQREVDDGAARHLAHAQRGRADHPDHRRRERQRQDDACHAAARLHHADDRADHLSRQGHQHAARRRSGSTFRREVQAVFQDPFAVFNPFYTVDHLLTVPIRRFKLAKSKAEARAKMDEALTRRRPAPRRRSRSLPASALRRPAPAHQCRARPVAQAAPADRRRAGIDGRRLAARQHPGDAAQSSARSRRLDHLHHP